MACGNCRGRPGSLSGIMQIVTSAVRVDVALTLSRRRSLFASAKFLFVWNTGRFSSTLMHRVLCAAGAYSLSVPWWLDQFTAPSKDDGFQWLDVFEIFFMCHVLDCHKQTPR